MIKKLLYLFLFVFASCSKGEKKSPNVFFAGEIVNPTNNYVVLHQGDVVIDSAKLDDNNRFTFRLDSIEGGLYHFNHAPELQYVYLEKGDSLMLRLNTVDFDESLVYTGSGEDINNFLINLFLANEEEELDVLSTYYPMEPEDFSKRMDSLRNLKLNDLEKLTSEVNLSKNAQEIGEATINYTYFNYKERYPYEHRGRTSELVMHELPDNFYDYRQEVSYDNKRLNYLRPYYYFMQSHVENLTFMGCSHDCAGKNNIVKNQLHYNKHKLKLIDSVVIEKELKDNLFRNVALYYLLKGHDKEENNVQFIKEFKKLSHNNRHSEEIDNLYEGILNIQPNKDIPDVSVMDNQGNLVSIKEIAGKKNTVFYFWSADDKKHFNDITQRALEVSKKKPEYSFVGINIMTDEPTWKEMVKNKGLDESKQFRAKDFKKLHEALIVYPMNKCIIAKDAKIVDAFSDMYASFQ